MNTIRLLKLLKQAPYVLKSIGKTFGPNAINSSLSIAGRDFGEVMNKWYNKKYATKGLDRRIKMFKKWMSARGLGFKLIKEDEELSFYCNTMVNALGIDVDLSSFYSSAIKQYFDVKTVSYSITDKGLTKYLIRLEDKIKS